MTPRKPENKYVKHKTNKKINGLTIFILTIFLILDIFIHFFADFQQPLILFLHIIDYNKFLNLVMQIFYIILWVSKNA